MQFESVYRIVRHLPVCSYYQKQQQQQQKAFEMVGLFLHSQYLLLARQALIKGHGIHLNTLAAAFQNHSRKRSLPATDSFFCVLRVSAYESFHGMWFTSSGASLKLPSEIE